MRYAILLLLALLLVLPASAKNDAYVEDLEGDWGSIDAPFALPAPLEWKAVHGRLGEFGDADAFSMHFDEAYEGWEIEVRVPVCGEHFTAVYPNIAVIGAGLESAEDLDLPFALADGMGAVMLSPSEVLSPRAEDSEFSFFMDTPNGTFYTVYYEEEALVVDIPAAGDYTLAIWEPDGHIGAYFLWIGNEHPDDITAYQSMEDLEAVFSLINSGEWMAQDCEAPLNAASCPAAVEALGSLPENDFPELSELGEGFVLTGTVYDAVTCMPLAGAEIDFEIDGLGLGSVQSNQQGAFQVVSNPGTNIHFYISAEGYESSVIEQLLDADEGEMQFAVSLAAGS